MFQGNSQSSKTAMSASAQSASTAKAKNAFLAARQMKAQKQQQQQQQVKFEEEQKQQHERSLMESSQLQSQSQMQARSQSMSSAMKSRKFSTFGSVVQKAHRFSSQKSSHFHSSSSRKQMSHKSSYSMQSRQEYERSLRESSYRGMSERRVRARSNWKWAYERVVQSIRESKREVKKVEETRRDESVRVEAKGKTIALVFDEKDRRDYHYETDSYYFDKNSKLHRSHSFSKYSSQQTSDYRYLQRTPSVEDIEIAGKSKLQLVREGYKHVPSEYVYYTVCTRYFHPENNDWIENIHRTGRVLVPRDVYHAEKCVFWHDLYEPDKEDMLVSKIIRQKKKKHRRTKSAGASPQMPRKKLDDVPIMYGSHSETATKKSESQFYSSSSSSRIERNSFHAESNMNHSMQTTMVY